MNSRSEEYRVRQWAVEYAIKHNNNSKAALKYKTSRQQIKRWRDRYDGTVQSLMPKSSGKWQKDTIWVKAGRTRDRIHENKIVFAVAEWESGKEPQAR